MARTITIVTNERAAHELDDLAERALTPTAILLAFAGLAGAVSYLPGSVFRWQPCALLAAVALVAIAGLCLRRQAVAGIVTLAVGQLLIAVPAGKLLPGSMSLVICLAIACSAALPWSAAPLVTAIGGSVLTFATDRLLQPQPYVAVAVLFYLMVGTALFFSCRASRLTLRWSWRRHTEALKLAEELRDRQGQLNRTIKALDLAYRLLQRTNHELAEARAEADEARQVKERFTANISHELRTPLNLILGFSEMMYVSPQVYGEVNWTKPLRRDVARIYEASRHLAQLVDDVLDLTRVQGEHMPLRKEWCDLTELATEAVATVSGLLRTSALRLRVEADPALPRLWLDGTRIRQVLLNLLSNAIRFTDEGEIVVTLRQRQADILVSVRDTGMGIPEQELASIFDEFYQSEMAAKKQGGGMGLGLAISKRIVQLHDGRIWAESTLGKGTTVSFTLPAGDSYVRTSRLKLSQPTPVPANPYADCVLLLGDEPDVAQVLERHLDGCRVFCAGDVGEAERLIAEHHPKAVIRNLPPSALARLASEVLSEGAMPAAAVDLPLLFCSIPSAGWRVEAMGVYGSLQKPIGKQQLLALLGRLGPVRDLLVIDDDQGFVQLLERMLTGIEGPGYRVRHAYTGAAGLAAMRKRVPEVVLLDLLMPEMSGSEVVAKMRADPQLARVPVIVLTAADVEEDMASFRTRAVGLVQVHGWALDDTLGAIKDLVGRVGAHGVRDAEWQAPPVGQPG